MGRAGQALKQTLTERSISQNQLAVMLGVRRSVVYRWFHEITDPTAETVADIVKALKELNPDAAEEFVRLYPGNLLQDEEQL